MLSDPQTITIGSSPGAVTVPRVSTGTGKSTYANSDGSVELILSSLYGKRNRRTCRVNYSKVSSDVFVPATNVSLSASCYVVFDAPAVGFTVTELKDMFAGLSGLMSASTYSVTTKLLGGES